MRNSSIPKQRYLVNKKPMDLALVDLPDCIGVTESDLGYGTRCLVLHCHGAIDIESGVMAFRKVYPDLQVTGTRQIAFLWVRNRRCLTDAEAAFLDRLIGIGRVSIAVNVRDAWERSRIANIDSGTTLPGLRREFDRLNRMALHVTYDGRYLDVQELQPA